MISGEIEVKHFAEINSEAKFGDNALDSSSKLKKKIHCFC